MKRKRTAIAISIVVLLAAAGIFAFTAMAQAREFQTVANLETAFLAGGQFGNQDFQPRIQRTVQRLGAYLNLTEAQKAQIKAILEAERPKVQPVIAQALATRQTLLAATDNGQFNETQVAGIAEQQGRNVAALIVEKERVKSQIYAVLTPEQRAKIEQLREEVEDKIRRRFSR